MAKVLIYKGDQKIPVGVVYNQNGGGTIQFWKGTDTEYKNLTDATLTELISNNTVFFIEEEDRT